MKQAATRPSEEARRRRRLSRRRVVLAVVCERHGYHLRVTASGKAGMVHDSWSFFTAAEVAEAVRGVLCSPLRFGGVTR